VLLFSTIHSLHHSPELKEPANHGLKSKAK
jgi:hypothetical protein